MADQWVCHFGFQVGHTVYNHNIDLQKWNRVRDMIPSTLTLTTDVYRIYHLGHLTFEVKCPQLTTVCYTDTNRLLPHELHALVFQRHRMIYDYEFQPINNYTDVQDVTRTTYDIDRCRLILEQDHSGQEIIFLSTLAIDSRHPTWTLLSKSMI